MFPESHGGLWAIEVTRRTLGSLIHLEIRVPRVNRNSGFPDSTGTPGSRGYLQLRVSRFTQNVGFLESPGTSRSH